MANIVYVHGVAQQLKGEETLRTGWAKAMRDGLRLAGAREEELPSDREIRMAFYGEGFRGRTKSGGGAGFELADIEEGLEAELVKEWARAAECDGQALAGNEWSSKAGHAPVSVQRLAARLLEVKFFAKATDKFLVGALKQLRWYLTEEETRHKVRSVVLRQLQPSTRLVVAHSLGSVVAYEALCAAGPQVTPAFVTLGSPLGLRNLVFDRLDPAPSDGRGQWPGGVHSWTNLADRHDVVATVKKLAPLFGERVRDVIVDNEALAHDVDPYLTAKATGEAMLAALRAT